jgi:hypothetical protein
MAYILVVLAWLESLFDFLQTIDFQFDCLNYFLGQMAKELALLSLH